MAEILIKDVASVASVNDNIKIPASTGGSKAETVTVGQIKEHIKKEVTTKEYVDKKNEEQDEKLRTLEGEIGKSIPLVNHGTSDTTFALTPDVYHVWGEVASLNLTQAPSEDGVGVYMFEFISGASATQLTLPSEWKWVGGLPTINTNKRYQIGVVNNLAKVDEYEK